LAYDTRKEVPIDAVTDKNGEVAMKLFYIRCSTEEQNEARQIRQAEEYGADKLFTDKASGKNTDRTKLREMLSYAREGDTIICSDISRVARHTKDLLNIVEELKRKDVAFVSLKEAIDTNTPQGQFMLTVFAAMAQLERDNILQRQAEGIAIAKAQGKYKGRKPIEIDDKKMKAVCKRWRQKELTAVAAQKELGLQSRTFYRKVRDMGL